MRPAAVAVAASAAACRFTPIIDPCRLISREKLKSVYGCLHAIITRFPPKTMKLHTFYYV